MASFRFLQGLLSQTLVAQDDAENAGLGFALLWRHLLAAVVFALVGVGVLFVCIWVFDKLSPYSFRKEILEDQNVALAIIVGASLLGVSLIIAAAIHG